MVERKRLLLPDTGLSRPALMLAQRFVQRWDLHAHQLGDGSYVCVHEPLNVSHLFAHLRGEITLGAYLLDQESRARFLVLDADDAQAWVRLGNLLFAQFLVALHTKYARFLGLSLQHALGIVDQSAGVKREIDESLYSEEAVLGGRGISTGVRAL